MSITLRQHLKSVSYWAKIRHTGDVDQNIHPSHLMAKGRGHLGRLVRLGYVTQMGQSVRQIGGGLFQCGLIAVDQGDGNTLGLQQAGGGQSDTAGSAGDGGSF